MPVSFRTLQRSEIGTHFTSPRFAKTSAQFDFTRVILDTIRYSDMELKSSFDAHEVGLYSSKSSPMVPSTSSLPPPPPPPPSSSSSSPYKPKLNQKRSVQFADTNDILDPDDMNFCEIENTVMDSNYSWAYHDSVENSNDVFCNNNKKKVMGKVKDDLKSYGKPKISPVRKNLVKAKLLQNCLARTKKNRRDLMERIRLGEARGDIAREIINDEMLISSDNTAIYQDCNNFTTSKMDHQSYLMPSMTEIDAPSSSSSFQQLSSILDDEDDEKYKDLMAEIYESICKEINEELNSVYIDDDNITDWGQLAEEEFRTIPDEALILCPFCRINFMGTDFELCVCNCICGMSFSFASSGHEMRCIGDLKEVLSSVYDRHSVVCTTVAAANINPAATLDFHLTDTSANLHAYCQECGYMETIF